MDLTLFYKFQVSTPNWQTILICSSNKKIDYVIWKLLQALDLIANSGYIDMDLHNSGKKSSFNYETGPMAPCSGGERNLT